MRALCFLLALPLAAGVRTDVEFAQVGDVHLTLDAWVPDGAGPFAAVIVVHGGGFVNGDKQTYVPPLFDPLTKGGFAWPCEPVQQRAAAGAMFLLARFMFILL